MSYIIYKASRCYQGGPGYTGPACDSAGVEPGKVYASKEEAEADAKKLAEVNPVGFTVEEYRDYKQPEFNPADWEVTWEMLPQTGKQIGK